MAQGFEVQHQFIPQCNDVFCLFPVPLVMIFNVLFLSARATEHLACISLEIHVCLFASDLWLIAVNKHFWFCPGASLCTYQHFSFWVFVIHQ